MYLVIAFFTDASASNSIEAFLALGPLYVNLAKAIAPTLPKYSLTYSREVSGLILVTYTLRSIFSEISGLSDLSGLSLAGLSLAGLSLAGRSLALDYPAGFFS